MSNDQKPRPPNTVRWMLFSTPLDFPGQQESNITTKDMPTETGVSYQAVFVAERQSVDVRMYRQGKLELTRSIPLAQIKQYEMV